MRTTGQIIEVLTSNPPRLHRASDGLTSGWRLDDVGLRYLDRSLQPGMRTIETGAGASTILFAAKRAEHTCIVPDAELAERIRACCGELGIDHATVKFVIAPSEHALPALDVQGIDMALIDGRHGFPAPFLDWYYFAERLKLGGMLLIDDVDIWICSILVEFLRSEPDWQLTATLRRSVAFTKRGNRTHNKEWHEQPFVFTRSAAAVHHKPAY